MRGSCSGRRRNRSRIHAHSRIGAVRRRSQGFRMRRGRLRHRALRIQQVVVARPQPQADQSARVGYRLRLPAVVGLIAPHGIFAGLIPRTRRVAGQIMLADQSFLDRLRPLGIDFLLASRGLPFAALARTRVLRFAAVARRGRTRLRVFVRCPMRCWMRLRLRGRASSTSVPCSRSVCLWNCRRVGRRRLPHRRSRRSAGIQQRQNATCAHPSSHFRAMLRFQRQPSEKINGQCSVTRPKPFNDSAAFTDH